jgi:NAD(P)-dependent dehydrogenase (short-subunit alcohol dehydrogenase family)
MVDLRAVRQSNAALRANPSGFVAVFVGATSGIGASTLKELVKGLSAPKFYVIGRSETRFSSQLAELKALNSGSVIIFIQAEISLLKDVDAVCEEVASKEAKVDLLFMSAGFNILLFSHEVNNQPPSPPQKVPSTTHPERPSRWQ